MPKSKAASRGSLHPLGELYGRFALNFLVDIAHALSYDFVVRPQNYRKLSDKTAGILTDFRFKLGSDPEWPDAFQRTLSFKVLCQISLASPAIREAALQVYRNNDAQRSDQFREAVRDAASSFRAQLEPLEGNALETINNQTRPIFERAVALFQDPEIAGAFGLPPAPADNWPIGSNFSGDASYLVASIVRGLRAVACLAGVYKRISRANPSERPLVPMLTLSLPQEKFINLQKAAYFGALTISDVLRDDRDIADPKVIDNAYKWTKALQKLVPDVSRAWKDLEYRSRLSDLEWGMAPNPSGETTPAMTTSLAFQTYTLHGEVCCCSGDLDCDPTSRLTDFCSEFQCPSVA